MKNFKKKIHFLLFLTVFTTAFSLFLYPYIDQMEDANQAIKEGNFGKAVKIFEQLYPHHSENKSVLLAYGKALFKNQQWDKAIKILDELLLLIPFHQEAHLLLGKIYIYLNKDLMALSHLERSITYDEDKKMQLESRYFLAGTLVRLGRYSSAAFEYQKIIESNPDDAYAYDQLARYYLTGPQPQLNKAIEAWEKVISLDKNKIDLDNRYNLGLAYFELGQFDKGFNYILEYNQVNRKDPEVLRLLGIYYREKGKMDKAIETLETAIQIDPLNGDVADDLAKIYSNEGDKQFNQRKFGAALVYFQKQFELFPENLELIVKLGKTFQQFAIFEAKTNIARQEAFLSSLNFYQKKLLFSPTDHDTYFEMSRDLFYVGDTRKALMILEKAAGIDPNQYRYHFWIAVMNRSLSKIKEKKKEEKLANLVSGIKAARLGRKIFARVKSEQIKIENFGITEKELKKRVEEMQKSDPLYKKLKKIEKIMLKERKKILYPDGKKPLKNKIKTRKTTTTVTVTK